MGIEGFYLLPHPPIVVPEVGRGEERKIGKTTEALKNISKDIKDKSPNTIILITPHSTMFRDAISLSYEDNMEGDLSEFGVPEVSMNISINKELTDNIYSIAKDNNIPIVKSTNDLLNDYNSSIKLDHGSIVPLYFINKFYNHYNIVHITYAPLSDLELYHFGLCIRKAVDKSNNKAIVVASGDLSHKLKNEGPYEYSPYGEKFDKKFINLLKEGNTKDIFNMDKKIINNAGECGRRSVIIMLGTLEGKRFKGNLLSYEGTFGVGYAVMKIDNISNNGTTIKDLKNLNKKKYKDKLNHEDPYVRLARQNLTSFLTTGKSLVEFPDYVTEKMKQKRRGVFVSLKKNGNLRGCIGTIFPVTDCIAKEIIRNSIEAGAYDPRFNRVGEDELKDIDFSVDILTEPKDTTISELNPQKYGVIVKSNGKSGVLLPKLDGVDTIEQQLSIVLRKAGINKEDNYDIQKFEVIRHKE